MTIAVGSASLTKGASVTSPGWTIVEKNGPAAVAIIASTLSFRNHDPTNITDLYIASFYSVGGNNYKCRDATYCGFVAANSVGVFTGKSLFFAAGDMIGAYFSVGNSRFSIHNDGIGILQYNGNACVIGHVGAYDPSAGSPNSVRLSATGDPSPTLISCTPNTGYRTQNVTAVLAGTLLTGATAVDFGAGITVNSYVVNSAIKITANITIAVGAALGVRTITVVAPGGTATLVGGFTVLSVPGVIDIGSGAIDGFGDLGGAAYTNIDMGNSANGDGYLDTISLWLSRATVGIRVGTFYYVSGSGLNKTYRCRDSVTLGDWGSGGKKTWVLDSLGQPIHVSVMSGDLIGIYYASGDVDYRTAAPVGVGVKAGEYIDPGDEALFGIQTGGTLSIEASSTIIPVITSVTPGTGNREQTKNVVIAGIGFAAGAVADFGTDILVNSTTFDSTIQLTVSITIGASAALGARSVSVFTSQGVGTKAAAFTVESGLVAVQGAWFVKRMAWFGYKRRR